MDIFLLGTDDTNPHIFLPHYLDYFYHAWVFDMHVIYYLHLVRIHFLYLDVDLVDGLVDFDLARLVLEVVEILTGTDFVGLLVVEVLTGID